LMSASRVEAIAPFLAYLHSIFILCANSRIYWQAVQSLMIHITTANVQFRWHRRIVTPITCFRSRLSMVEALM
jgi:hypothetical protein